MDCFSIIYSKQVNYYHRRHMQRYNDQLYRLEAINNQFHSSHMQRPNYISQLMYERRSRIMHAFQPHLTDISRRLTAHEYRKILPKILEARAVLKDKFNNCKKESLNDRKAMAQVWQQFSRCLANKLYQIMPGMLNELADRLVKRIEKVPNSNLIGRSLKIYSSVMGSYQQKLTLLQKLSPTVRTLSFIEREMMQHSGDRQLSGSIWVLLYIFSFAFVQMFGKYITQQQKAEVVRIIKINFVRNLSIVAGNLQLSEKQSMYNRLQLADQIDGWIQEIAKNIA